VPFVEVSLAGVEGGMAFGWDTHIHSIRSPEKLTAGGMSFLDTDVVRVI